MEPIYTAEEVADLLKSASPSYEPRSRTDPCLISGWDDARRYESPRRIWKYLDAKEEHSNGAHPDDVGEDDG